MDYLLCIPAREDSTRENCEKIHNILARMSDQYKLRIVPEPVKNKQFQCPPYYKKYRIYKPVKERDNNGEAFLEKEEEDMILSVCKTPEEQELMKNCIYAYQYSASIVLKSFRDKEKRNKRPELRENRENRAKEEKLREERSDRFREGREREERPREERPREDRSREERPREGRFRDSRGRGRDGRPREDRTRDSRPREERAREDRVRENKGNEEQQSID